MHERSEAAEPQDAEASEGRATPVARHRRLVRRTFLVSTLTLASRIVGFLRESLSASIFGDRSPINDAFVTAWRVPNLFRSLLGEGAISASMLTALTRADAEQGDEAGRRLFVAILRVVGVLSFAACALGMLLVYLLPDTMPFTGWHWLGETPGPVRELTLRMLPFVVFVCLSAVCGGALQVRGHFLAPSLAPVVMNIGWIASLFLVVDRFGWLPIAADTEAEYARQLAMARMLAWYAIFAGAILVCVQVPALVRERLIAGPRTRAAAPRAPSREVWDILRTSVPLALGAAVYQINVMIDGWMAVGLLPEGGPSLLYYATRVQQFPMALIPIAATSAVFPALTAHGHRREIAAVRALHDRTHFAIAFAAVPASLGLFVFAEPVIAACFHHGAFGADGVLRAAAGLRALAFAILPAGAAGLVARTYYALGDFRTPVRISIAMLGTNAVLNVLFVAGLRMDLEGLALATALTSWGNLAWLLPGLSRRLGLPPSGIRPLRRLAPVIAAACASTLAARGLYALRPGVEHSALALAVAIGAAVVFYGASAHWLGIPEWRQLLERLSRLGVQSR